MQICINIEINLNLLIFKTNKNTDKTMYLKYLNNLKNCTHDFTVSHIIL